MKLRNMALLAVITVGLALPASATIQYKDTYPSCIDAPNPEVACFGGDVLTGSPDPNDPNYGCLLLYKSCRTNCKEQQEAGNTACARIDDPIEQANCLVTVDLNAQACADVCSFLSDCFH